MSQLSIVSVLPLPNSKVTIPQLGFGVYDSPASKTVQSCLVALRAGYRQIDSAQFYRNEAQVGESYKKSGYPREQLFLTSKTLHPGPEGTVDSTYDMVAGCIKKLGGGDADAYADLFLVHTARGGSQKREIIWKALERHYEEGRCRAIGVSNWGVGHMEEMKSYSNVWPPHVLQIELHPWCQQREVVEYCQKHGVVVQAYCPIVRNEKANDPILSAIAKKHKKTPSQVLIRWSLQKGWVPLPKSDTPSRIEGNADVYDFALDKDDMESLNGCDQGAAGAIVESVVNDQV